MKYRYWAIAHSDPKKEWVRRPMVEVKITHGDHSIHVLSLVDSGADRTLFNGEVAEALGINLSVCEVEDTIGIAGKIMPVALTEATIEIEHQEPVTIPIGFINSNSVGGLLGQKGFFDCYKIKFSRTADIFEISPDKNAPKEYQPSGRKR